MLLGSTPTTAHKAAASWTILHVEGQARNQEKKAAYLASHRRRVGKNEGHLLVSVHSVDCVTLLAVNSHLRHGYRSLKEISDT